MAVLRVISHIPTINATGVYLNDTIQVTFDKRIRPETVDYTTLSVNNHSTYVSVPGSYSIDYDSSGNALTAVFTPALLLTPNTNYDVYVYGNPDSILSLENEYVSTTYSFSFTTGINIWDSVDGSGELPASGLDPVWTGVLLNIPPSVTGSIASFYVYSTTPRHQTPDVDIDISGIVITFTGTIQTSLSEMSGYITLEEVPVLY